MPNYFAPRTLEEWRGRSIYERVGVRFFKRVLLPDAFLRFRLRRKKARTSGRGGIEAELRRLEWETRRNEAIHVLALLLTGCLLVLRRPHISIGQWFVILAINLYVNVYPIFVQRYNRFRLLRLMRACQSRQAEDDLARAT